jgi:hypothetical protein
MADDAYAPPDPDTIRVAADYVEEKGFQGVAAWMRLEADRMGRIEATLARWADPAGEYGRGMLPDQPDGPEIVGLPPGTTALPAGTFLIRNPDGTYRVAEDEATADFWITAPLPIRPPRRPAP